jgi:hypothetical protein
MCAFDMKSPRISAYDIHEWMYVTMSLKESEVALVQIDGPVRQVYIKFRDPNKMYNILRITNVQGEFKHANGEIAKVRIEAAGLGIRKVRMANIPPEISDRTIKMGLKWVRRGERGPRRKLVNSIPLPCSKWHPDGNNPTITTYPVTYPYSRIPNINP